MQAVVNAPNGFLITGGTGMVGRAIAAELGRRQLRLVQAVRGEAKGASASVRDEHWNAALVCWQPQAQTPFANTAALEGMDVAVHLSGANLASRRWTPAFKREIVSSRTETTGALAGALARLERPPRLLITASATGIYGSRGDEVLTEASLLGHDFLSETCKAWEAAALPAVEQGVRVVHLRLGVVLAPQGGALAKVLPLFRAGVGGRLGNGRQWMSWIAIDDVVRAVLHIAGYGADEVPQAASGPAFDTRPAADRLSATNQAPPAGGAAPVADLEGPINCIAPGPVTNAEYTRALARTLGKPAFAAAPAFALRLALGEMADAALLSSCRALPQKLVASGFGFRFPEIGAALAHLLPR